MRRKVIIIIVILYEANPKPYGRRKVNRRKAVTTFVTPVLLSCHKSICGCKVKPWRLVMTF